MVALDICPFSCSSHPAECKDCEHHAEGHASEESPVVKEALKERPAEEVTARLAQQEQEETDVLTCRLPSVQLTAAAFPSSVEFSKTLKAKSPEAKTWLLFVSVVCSGVDQSGGLAGVLG